MIIETMLFIVVVLLAILIMLLNRILRTRKNYFNDEKNCPICGTLYDLYRHKKVKYHITYNPQKWVYACELCNEIEYLQRSGNLNKILEKIEDLKK